MTIKRVLKIVAIVGVLGFAVLVAVTPAPSPEEVAKRQAEKKTKAEAESREEAAKQKAETKREALNDARARPDRQMAVSHFHWKKAGFGNVMEVSLKIENQNDFTVKDVRFACDTYGRSGTALSDVRQTIYETIPAHATLTLRNVNIGFISNQSAQADCHIVLAEVI